MKECIGIIQFSISAEIELSFHEKISSKRYNFKNFKNFSWELRIHDCLSKDNEDETMESFHEKLMVALNENGVTAVKKVENG